MQGSRIEHKLPEGSTGVMPAGRRAEIERSGRGVGHRADRNDDKEPGSAVKSNSQDDATRLASGGLRRLLAALPSRNDGTRLTCELWRRFARFQVNFSAAILKALCRQLFLCHRRTRLPKGLTVTEFHGASYVELPIKRLQIIPARWHRRRAIASSCMLGCLRSEWRLIQVLFSSNGGGGPPAPSPCAL